MARLLDIPAAPSPPPAVLCAPMPACPAETEIARLARKAPGRTPERAPRAAKIIPTPDTELRAYTLARWDERQRAAAQASPTGEALGYLCAICDGARFGDNRGFGGSDTEGGHDLAQKFLRYGSWASAKQLAFAQRMAHKYRRQLLAAGFDMTRIAEEVFVARTTTRPAPTRIEVAIRSVKRRTSLAALIVTQAGAEVWLPLSQCAVTDTTVSLPEWLAREKGLAA